jgi:hypothetical protein
VGVSWPAAMWRKRSRRGAVAGSGARGRSHRYRFAPPTAGADRRSAAGRLERFELQGEGLGRCRQRRELVSRTKGREIGPVAGVGAFGRRCEVRGREIVLDGAREIFERGEYADDGGRRREFQALGARFGHPD